MKGNMISQQPSKEVREVHVIQFGVVCSLDTRWQRVT
ncbi:hypothetical protein GBF38_021281, partial [Nibea albiflora]